MNQSSQHAGGNRRKRMSRTERKRQILRTAEEIFTERGYQPTSMDEIASQVGLSKPMLYEYFGSKDGLLLALITEVRQGLLAATTSAIQDETTPEGMLRQGLRAFFEYIAGHGRAWSLLQHETAVMTPTVAEEIEGIRRQQTEFTGAVMRAHLPEATDEEVEAHSEAIIGACEQLAKWQQRSASITAEQVTEYLMRLTYDGLASAAKPR